MRRVLAIVLVFLFSAQVFASTPAGMAAMDFTAAEHALLAETTSAGAECADRQSALPIPEASDELAASVDVSDSLGPQLHLSPVVRANSGRLQYDSPSRRLLFLAVAERPPRA